MMGLLDHKRGKKCLSRKKKGRAFLHNVPKGGDEKPCPEAERSSLYVAPACSEKRGA